MKRRSFLRAAGLAPLALTPVDRLFALAPDHRYLREIGLQLYTLRGPLAEDLEGTMKAVAAAGYKQVELMHTPLNQRILPLAKELGLAVHSGHIDMDAVFEAEDKEMAEFRKQAENYLEAGLDELVIPYIKGPDRRTLDDYKRLAAAANRAGAIARELGARLSFHNHAFEFEPLEGERCGYDVFIDEFGENAHFEVDVFWVAAAGRDPVALIEKLGKRVTQLHLKDLRQGLELPLYDGMPKDGFEELGEGVIPMAPILAAAEKAGVSHCHVEQDHSPHPLRSVRTSLAHLKQL